MRKRGRKEEEGSGKGMKEDEIDKREQKRKEKGG